MNILLFQKNSDNAERNEKSLRPPTPSMNLEEEADEIVDKRVWDEAPMVHLIKKAEGLAGNGLVPLVQSLDVVRAAMEKVDSVEEALMTADDIVKIFMILRLLRGAIRKWPYEDLIKNGIDRLG